MDSVRNMAVSSPAQAMGPIDRVLFLALGSIGDVLPIMRAANELATAPCSVHFATHAAHKVPIMLYVICASTAPT